MKCIQVMKIVEQCKKYILKSSYLDSRRDRLRGGILSLIMLVTIVIMAIDLYGSIKGDFVPMAWIESILIAVFVLLYLLFPKHISLDRTATIFIGLIMLLIVASLTLPGYNKEFSLFALAAMPASIFFLLDLNTGVRWSMVTIFLIFVSMLNALMHWTTPVFNASLLLEVNIAYVIITYFYYRLEKERGSYECQLSQAIKEKDVLLQEIHHRAKNNLQTIMGLLESQAMRAEDQTCKKLLRSQRHRLQSMSLLHQNLAHETGYEKVNMSEYLTQIVNNLQKITDHVLDAKIENFRLDMSKAINLGLLLNEAVSNAIEHAYPKDRIGEIEIHLKRTVNHCRLSVKDFGKGFDASTSYRSLGLVLMDDIIHFFPKGELAFDFEHGTEVIVEFSL